MQATCSRVVEAVAELTAALQHKANVISIAEEMAYPAYQAPHIAATLHQLAIDNQVTVVGTGIHPGFVLDLLVIALRRLAPCGGVGRERYPTARGGAGCVYLPCYRVSPVGSTFWWFVVRGN